MKIVEIQEDRKVNEGKIRKDIDISISNTNTDVSQVEDTKDASLKLYKEKTCQVIDEIKKMKLPGKNEQLRLVTKRSFNAVAFLKFICENEDVDYLYCCIYSINYEAATVINELVRNGKIKKATFLISNLRNTAYRVKEELVKQMFIDNKNIKLLFASSHAKIMSFKTSKGNYYTIEGSGNLSSGSRIEQYVVDNDKVLYDFTEKWVNEMIEFLKGKKELTVYE